ncbi:MAG: hypothetical protein GC191_08060 [Azospirillum sp.]|nr:hypothetical protein [Azospirillum sp.]
MPADTIHRLPIGTVQPFRAITAGRCKTYAELRTVAAALAEAERQSAMFADLPQPTPAERRAANSFEVRVARLAAVLRDGIKDNEIAAVRKVDPTRAGTLADLLAAAAKALRRIETALRRTEAQTLLIPV